MDLSLFSATTSLPPDPTRKFYVRDDGSIMFTFRHPDAEPHQSVTEAGLKARKAKGRAQK